MEKINLSILLLFIFIEKVKEIEKLLIKEKISAMNENSKIYKQL